MYDNQFNDLSDLSDGGMEPYGLCPCMNNGCTHACSNAGTGCFRSCRVECSESCTAHCTHTFVFLIGELW